MDHSDDIDTEATRAFKGRGAVTSPGNRYSNTRTEVFDDGWDSIQEVLGGKAPETLTLNDDSKTIITTNRSPDIPFEQSINPYRGCEHGCIYCYARPTHAFWDLSPGLDFESKIVVKTDAAELLRAKLSSPKYEVKPICIGANTDPYQPLESRLKTTRSLLEILAEFRHPFSLITKSTLVTRDLDILAPLAEENLCSIAVSVTTMDDQLKRIMEPRTPSGHARVSTLKQLTNAGIRATLLAAPMIPCINDHELESIMALGREAGADSCRYILLRLPLEISPMFQAWLKSHFPDRAEKVMSIIRQSREGNDYQNAFGKRMTGTGQFADLIRQRWLIASRKLGYRNEDRFDLDGSQFVRINEQLDLFQ
jgi:DNA repair photolyase